LFISLLTSCGNNTIYSELIGTWEGQLTDELKDAGIARFELRFTRDGKMYTNLERNGAKSSGVANITTKENQLFSKESVATFTIHGDTLTISADGAKRIYIKAK
jgi:hypothetical protein